MQTLDATESAAAFLKHHTAQAHRELEDIVFPQLQALRSITDYIAVLKNFYGYFKPAERRIEAQLNQTFLPDLPLRRKAHFILRDLTFSKAHIEDLPLAQDLPQIENVYQALGTLYVLEGSTLGGRGITKMLLKNEYLHLQPNQIHFFNGYGAETGMMWTRFLAVLNENGKTDFALSEMASAANQTFTRFKHWLQTSV